MNPTVCLEINHPNTLNEITKSCEKLITETQRDIETFRNDQQQLQQQIAQVLQENHQINSKLEILKGGLKTDPAAKTTCESRDDALREKLTNDAFKNVKKQIDYLEAENNDLRSLNKTYKIYLENQEKEIQDYRNELFNPISVGEVKQKYTTTIKFLESTIVNQESDLKEQTQVIEDLFEQKKQLRDHIENLQKCIEEKDEEIKKHSNTTEAIDKLQKQLTETVLYNKELQKSLKISRDAIEERFKKEQSALQKVQEALTIAEAAVADKEEAMKREKVVKEECDNIASTIGEVMDEAARNVEKDIETIKKKFIDKENALIEEMTKLTEEIQNQKKFNQILDKRCNRFKQKFQEALKFNENLSQQLEITAKALYDMEEKLNKINSINNNEAILQKRSDEQEFEIQQYVKTNKQLQDKYRMAVEDVTKKLKKQISHLENEVTNLKAENHVLKLQNCYET